MTEREGGREEEKKQFSSFSLFCKTQFQSSGPFSWSLLIQLSPKAPSSNTITTGVRGWSLNTWILWGYKYPVHNTDIPWQTGAFFLTLYLGKWPQIHISAQKSETLRKGKIQSFHHHSRKESQNLALSSLTEKWRHGTLCGHLSV